MNTELGRRGFLVLSAGALAMLSGTAAAQDIEDLDEPVQGTAILIGPESNRPEPGGDWFDQWDGGPNHIYITRDFDADDKQVGGKRFFYIDGVTDDWVQLPTHLPTFADADLPAQNVEAGYLAFDSDRGVPTWSAGSTYESPNFASEVLTSAVTVSNDATKTSVWSIDLNARSLIKGRTYQLDLMGIFSTANTSDQFTIIIELGGAELATLQNEPANATDAPWAVETTFTVRSHGENGEVQPHSQALFNSQPKDDHHSSITVDTTVLETLEVFVNWDAADANNSVTLGQGHLKVMS